MSDAVTFEVSRTDPRATRFYREALAPLRDGEIRLAIDRFALTANNITYATFGEALGYWGFFPAGAGYGRIPAWGFGTVVDTRCDDVRAGERFYGYYPMASHLTALPVRVDATGFGDGVAHRAALHPLYSRYANTEHDPLYDAAREAHALLLRPLYITSFVIDDLLDDAASFGAEAVVLSSASSKTAWGVAFLQHARRQRVAAAPRAVALTSARSAPYVRALGLYDDVATYDDFESVLPASTRVAYVDFAGDPALTARVHRHFGDDVRFSLAVGASHASGAGDAAPAAVELPGARPLRFFAPDRIRQRSREWGAAGFASRFGAAWHDLLAALEAPGQTLLDVVERSGPGAVEDVYVDTLAGHVPPRVGNVLALRA